MSMHLENPGLTMTGKKKGKQKFRNAADAQKARQLAAEWEELQKKYEPKKIVRKVFKQVSLSPNMPTQRQTQAIPSLVTPGGDCSKKEIIQYTGTEMLGIGQLHKSNAVPVFRTEDAADIARMRR
jgi:hypothetical protein